MLYTIGKNHDGDYSRVPMLGAVESDDSGVRLGLPPIVGSQYSSMFAVKSDGLDRTFLKMFDYYSKFNRKTLHLDTTVWDIKSGENPYDPAIFPIATQPNIERTYNHIAGKGYFQPINEMYLFAKLVSESCYQTSVNESISH